MLRFVLLFALVPIAALAQAEAVDTLAVPGGETFTLDAPAATYRVHVVRPPGYDADRPEPYPVLYFADAWWLTSLTAGVQQIAVRSERSGVEPFILVGIGVDGDLDAFTAQRGRDLTPTPVPFPLQFDGVLWSEENTGGAPAFLAFLRDALVPRIEGAYHADPARRGWMGHSLGGLFGAWSLQAAPDLFRDLILIAPAVWWNQSEVTKAGFPAVPDRLGRVFVAYGTSESVSIVGPTQRLVGALDAAGYTPIAMSYEGADHHSVLPPAFWDGVVALYGR